MESFLTNGRETVRLSRAEASRLAIDRAKTRALRTLDLSQIAPAARDDEGTESAALLMEILDRIVLPPFEEIPDVEEVQASGLTSWTIPNTEITIARTEEGPYAGTFQFTAATVRLLPRFYERSKHLPNRSGALVGLYEDLIYLPGPLLPTELTSDLPEFAYDVIYQQTIWQWSTAIVTLLLGAVTIVLIYQWGLRIDNRFRIDERRRHFGRLTAMVIIIPVMYLTLLFIDEGVNITGRPLFLFSLSLGIAMAVAAGWLIVLVLNAIGETIIRVRALGPGNVDAQLVRIVTRLLAVVALIYLAIHLAELYGVPAAPLLASLGVGGLAIALAVRPTLENIVAGFILFADKPVRVGQFCRFGDKMGTVEQIGLRSTRIRGLDRTIITVPNADFAQLEIVNFAERDEIMLRTTIGLRYETTPDQLRYVLTKLRELFVAHPSVSPQPARARFIGFGSSSLDIEIYVYVKTNNYNEYLGIAEDVYFRIMDIVEEAGSGFAFPSQTAYLARDTGFDAERIKAVESEVQGWRDEETLQFPALDPKRVESLDGTLDFPPKGSTHYSSEPDEPTAAAAAPDFPAGAGWRARRKARRSGPDSKR